MMAGIRFFSMIFVIFFAYPQQVSAQQQVGTCYDQIRVQAFALFNNYFMHQIGAPMNNGYAVPDPSGLMFLRVPAANPFFESFFIDWGGNLVQINQMGASVIGYCDFAPGYQPTGAPQHQVPQLADWGVRTQSGVQPVPKTIFESGTRYVEPLLASEQTAEQCLNSSDQEDEFADCMLGEMLGEKEHNVYECSKENDEVVDLALCSIGANGGPNEQEIVANIKKCRESHGDDWDEYPLCMLEDTMSEDQARLVGCLKDQYDDGTITLTGTAVCYGAGSFQPNAELQIAMECAVTTGGNPMAFAGCAGGRLTERELTKCVTHGVGGDGCFGPNNEIVKALRAVGIDVKDMFGATNDVTIAWNNAVNDLQNGLGSGNEAVKAITTISNDIANGPGQNNEIVRAVDVILPGFSSLF